MRQLSHITNPTCIASGTKFHLLTIAKPPHEPAAVIQQHRGHREMVRCVFRYCKKITGIAAIDDLPRVRRLTLVGCGNIGLSTIEAKVSTLEWANTGAPR